MDVVAISIRDISGRNTKVEQLASFETKNLGVLFAPEDNNNK